MSIFPLNFSRRRASVVLCLVAAVSGTGLGWLGRAVSKSRTSGTRSAADTADTAAGGFFQNPSGAWNSLSSGGLHASGHDAAAAARMSGFMKSGLTGGSKDLNDWLQLLAAAEDAPPGVLSRLLNLLENENEPAVTRLLATRWSQQDPGGLCALLEARRDRNPPGSAAARRREDLEKILAREWFRQNPEALIQSLGKIDSPWQLRTAKTELLLLLVDKDPGRGVKLMLGWRLPLNSMDGEALVTWVRANPQQAATTLLFTERRPDYSGAMDRDRTLILTETAKAWAARDPAGALKMKSDGPNLLLEDFRALVAREWLRRDLPSAIVYLSGSEASQQQKNDWAQTYPWGESLLQVWGATDPAAALAWADSQLTGSAQKNAASALLKTLTARDPQRALDFLDQLPPGSAKDRATEVVARIAMQGKDKPQVLEIFQKLTAQSDPDQRAIALKATVGRLLTTVPEEFLAWFKTPEGAQAPWKLLEITAQNLMSQKDATAAMNWAAGVRPEASSLVRGKILEDWIAQDGKAASEWIQNLPVGEGRADLIAGTVTSADFTIAGDKLRAWIDSLPASDHPAILKGLSQPNRFDPGQKAELTAKYSGVTP